MSILCELSLLDKASITDNGDRFKLKTVFAVSDELADEVSVKKWFSTSEVELSHSCTLKLG